MEIGNQIKKYRTELGLNQEELADRVYVTRQTVSNWENERSYPDIRSLLLLSGVFGISLDILVKGDVEQMKVQIREEDIRIFRRESLIYELLLGGTILLAIPLARWFGWGGRKTEQALAEFKNALNYGTPKYAVWCVGMNNEDVWSLGNAYNNPDSWTVNATWKAATDEFLEICEGKAVLMNRQFALFWNPRWKMLHALHRLTG